MAALKWLTGLVLAGSLVSCAPQTPEATDVAADVGSADIGSQFVSDLIANATQAEEEQLQARVRRSRTCAQDNSLVVDLGYAKYRGFHNGTTGLSYWRGIRYAAPPTGKLRWQPPQPLPAKGNAPVTDAAEFGPVCPQAMPSVPGMPFIPGNEDCLFLNVYAPSNASNLPVLVYIHGGGYGYGDGSQDMSEIINANEQGFVAVTLQYRLGAFGWLSSAEVKMKGVVNAGLLDQALALAWVEQNICQFGGDPSRVTISGEPAGAGSVMYHGIAVKGGLGTLLFRQGIAASPYLPFQPRYDDALPTSRYYAFSQAAGCPGSGNVFSCPVGKDTDTLQQASFSVTQSALGFWPVTDGSYVMNRPSQQFAAGKLNGKNLLVGHNANEGGLFVPPVINTQDDLVGWLRGAEFPGLTTAQINTILAANPNDAPTNASGPRFATDGLGGATAVQVAQDANGQQQRANNIYAEATFACPAYWLAGAYSAVRGSSAWLYQYSVPYAYHTTDITAYFGPRTPNQSADLALAFRRIWGNFVVRENPSVSAAVANGAAAADPAAPHPAANWPAWTESAPQLLNLNSTSGVPYQAALPWGPVVTQFADPRLRNAITLAAADRWEGGRKARCDVYRSLADSIPV